MAFSRGLTLLLLLSVCSVSLARFNRHSLKTASKITTNHITVPVASDNGAAETPAVEVGVAIPRATPCETPVQWEGRASEWDHIIGINNRYNITYDGRNRRKRIMEVKKAKLPGHSLYEYIMLYDEGIQYTINHKYNTCIVEPLGTWRNHTIPPNSTLEDIYEIGNPDSDMMVEEWSDRIPGRRVESWIGTFAVTGCWPIMEIFMEKDETLTMVTSVSTRFFDLKLGVKNMSVFTPPPYCLNQSKHPTEPESPTHPEVPPPKPNHRRLTDQGRVVLEKVQSAVQELPRHVDRLHYEVIARQHGIVAGQGKGDGRFGSMNPFRKLARKHIRT